MLSWSELSTLQKFMAILSMALTQSTVAFVCLWHFGQEPALAKVASVVTLAALLALDGYLILRRKWV